MENNNNFKNLWLFDLVAMLALLFMAIILLRAEETKKTTMPVVTSIAADDSANFSILTCQINELYNRLIPHKDREAKFIDFREDEKTLKLIFSNSDYLNAQRDSTLDIFSRLDTIMHTRKKSGELIQKLSRIRDYFLGYFLLETRIERKLIGEDELMFPFDEAIPYKEHPVSKKRIEEILKNINDSVDSFLNQGYNIVTVIGHTDSQGTPIYNRELSLRRARYLTRIIQDHIDKRYKPDKRYVVEAVGYGEFAQLERKPHEKIEEFYQRNRRVELVFSRQNFDAYSSKEINLAGQKILCY